MDVFVLRTLGTELPIGTETTEIHALCQWFAASLGCPRLTPALMNASSMIAANFAVNFDFPRLHARCQELKRCAGAAASLKTPMPFDESMGWNRAKGGVVDELMISRWATEFIREALSRISTLDHMHRFDRVMYILELAACIGGMFDMVIILAQDNRREILDAAIPFMLWVVVPQCMSSAHSDTWDFALADVIKPLRADAPFNGDFQTVFACPRAAFLERFEHWLRDKEGLWSGYEKQDIEFRSFSLSRENPVRIVAK